MGDGLLDILLFFALFQILYCFPLLLLSTSLRVSQFDFEGGRIVEGITQCVKAAIGAVYPWSA